MSASDAPENSRQLLRRFDCTFHTSENFVRAGTSMKMITQHEQDLKDILAWCTEKCSLWCFQLERGEKEGHLHFQIRIELKCEFRTRFTTMMNKNPFPGKAFWSPTSNRTAKDNFNYVMKEETRVAGPWSNLSMPTTTIIPDDIENIELYPWQEEFVNMITSEGNTRKVHIIYSKDGCIGGSVVLKWLRFNKDGILLLPSISANDMMADAYGYAKVKGSRGAFTRLICLDLAKKIDPNKLMPIYEAVETMKNGLIIDRRNNLKEIVLKHTPSIVIKTNTLPGYYWLSPDRWVIWDVIDGKLTQIPFDRNAEKEESNRVIALRESINFNKRKYYILKRCFFFKDKYNMTSAECNSIQTKLDLAETQEHLDECQGILDAYENDPEPKATKINDPKPKASPTLRDMVQALRKAGYQ